MYPEAQARVRESIADDHVRYLDQRLREGCRSSTRLWRELQKLGFSGQVNTVRLLSINSHLRDEMLLGDESTKSSPSSALIA